MAAAGITTVCGRQETAALSLYNFKLSIKNRIATSLGTPAV